MIDCIIIGYNDDTEKVFNKCLYDHNINIVEKNIFNRNHVFLAGKPMTYLDVLNYGLEMVKNEPSYYHLSEVSNLAAIYLKNYLQNLGYRSEFVSSFNYEKKKLLETITSAPTLSIAITTTFYESYEPVKEICSEIKRINPNIRIIIGGPLVYNLTHELHDRSLSKVFLEIGGDYYIKESQGELTLSKVIDLIKHGGLASSIPNLFYKDNEEFTFTYIMTENNKMDNVTINWDYFSNYELGATVQTRSARSCAYSCSFCDFPLRAGSLSLTSIPALESELLKLQNRGVNSIVFVDDTFNVPEKRFKEICNLFIKNKFNFKWYSYFRCSSSKDEETYQLMSESGCGGVFLGIESADNNVLKNMKKIANVELYSTGIGMLRKYNILTFASFFVGFPGETANTVNNTIQFIKKTKPDFYRVEPWWYNHRSPIFEKSKEFNIIGQGYNWSHSTMTSIKASLLIEKVVELVGYDSLWCPQQSYSFWAFPYLLGKGMSTTELKEFHKIMQQLMTFNNIENREIPEFQKNIESLYTLCRNLNLKPSKYIKLHEQ